MLWHKTTVNLHGKIIFSTAKGREGEIAKGLALGADAYITKPFSNTELVAKVKDLLEKTNEEAGEQTLESCNT